MSRFVYMRSAYRRRTDVIISSRFATWAIIMAERASQFLRYHLTFSWCLAVALLMYAIVWITAVYRLHEPSICAKNLVAATMIARTVGPAAGSTTTSTTKLSTNTTKGAATLLRQLRERFEAPPTTQAALVFHSTPTAPSTAVETEFVMWADELANTEESSADFIPALIRYNLAAEQLSDYSRNEKPIYARFWAEHWYNGCDVGLPLYGRGSLRESARLYLEYANAFAGVWPMPAIDGGKIDAKLPPTTFAADAIRRGYAHAARSTPPMVVAAPWKLLRFRDPLFAELCSNSPRSIFFLLVSLIFFIELRFNSVGPTGLFAHTASIPRAWAVLTATLAGVVIGVPLVVEGRETWVELLRLLPVSILMLAAGTLLANLVAIDRMPLSLEFMTLHHKARYQRLLPFAIAATTFIAGALWGIYYSASALLTQFELGPVLRGILQIGALTLMLVFTLRLGYRLLLNRPPPTLGQPLALGDEDDGDVYREFAKALMLVLPPLAAGMLEKFLAR